VNSPSGFAAASGFAALFKSADAAYPAAASRNPAPASL
jgi:hypothetical protein